MVQLRSLEVRNIRGVRQLSVELGDKSIVLLGPNGAGKSSVVDAVDFLLTGEVRRLSGVGAGLLSLAEHGRNVLAQPEDVWVSAVFTVLEGTSERNVTLRRTLAAPAKLDWVGKPAPTLSDMLERVRRSGHHLLSRRDVLKFILAQPGERHEQVASLMQLGAIEDIRKELQGAAKNARAELKTLTATMGRLEKNLLSCLEPPARDVADLLDRVNAHRKTLGAPSLAALGAPAVPTIEKSIVRADIDPPEVSGAHPLQSARTAQTIAALLDWFARRDDFAARTRAYAEDVAKLRADSTVVTALQARDLVIRGLELATKEECPLCLRAWNSEELRGLLVARIQASEEASARLNVLNKTRAALVLETEGATTLLRTLVGELSRGTALPVADIQRALEAMTEAPAAMLPDPAAGVTPTSELFATFAAMLADVSTVISLLDEQSKALPRLEGVRKVWDELGAVERALGEIAKIRAELPAVERLANALAAADELFPVSRDEVLTSMYATISGRLQELYAGIHGKGDGGEQDFSASLRAEGPGLKLEVDFYGRGKFPPAALHSEGHQDTLGICLFLALAEQASGGTIPILILDDVLMSVDAEHRRAVAEMLRREYAKTQFVITTHDPVWAKQLRSVGLAGAPLALRTRTLEDGARSTAATEDPILGARAALAEGRVDTAAHALRRGLEARLQQVCEALGGKVRFKSRADYDLGDFRDAVKAAFADALKKALIAAPTWGMDTATLHALQAAYTAASKLVEAEEWSVNPAVHYNDWATLSVEDFAPIVDAYATFLAFFECSSCNGDLAVVEQRQFGTKVLTCGCDKTKWHLLHKAKTPSK